MHTIKLFFKKYTPLVYIPLRRLLFPVWLKIYRRKAVKFITPEWKQVRYQGQVFDILLDPKNGFIDTTIYVQGVYEDDILSLIASHLKPGDVFVDIGANIGQHTLFAACLVGATGKVIAFEPNKTVAKQLRKSIEKNNFKMITLKEVGLGSKKEDLNLFIPQGNAGGASISPYNKDTISQKIYLEKGDSLLKNKEKISFIKIDTEGYELEVINGLQEVLKTKKPIVLFEYSPVFWKKSPLELGVQLLTTLSHLGYVIIDVEDGNRVVQDIPSWVGAFSKSQTNFICFPDKN